MAALNASIPLECTICPKKPGFSDVSHLLTHIQSKAHQSRYYTLKVKATTDGHINQLLQEYNQWESENSIDDLMAERIDQKEKRTAGRNIRAPPRRGSGGQSSTRRTSKYAVRRRANAARREVTASTSSRSTPAAPTARRAMRPLRDSVLNPQLDARIKLEPISRPGTPGCAFSMEQMGYFNTTRYIPQAWPESPYAGTPPMKQESFSSEGISDDEDDSFVLEPAPQPRRMATARRRRNDSNDETSQSFLVDEEWDEIGETTSDVAKLKGLVWPGMAMFDSATPDMRRKRNQKKDYSVIEQLMATSVVVEPEEMVFDSEGNLRRQRLIDGNPEIDDDESLLSGEIEPEPELPKKRVARRPRTALVEKNRNTGRLMRNRPASARLPAVRPPRRSYYDGPGADDDDLTYAAPRPKKRTGISIHRDNSGPEITFDNPASMAHLNSGFRNNTYQQQMSSGPRTQSFYNQAPTQRAHQRLPSFTAYGPANTFGSSFRPSNGSMGGPNFASFGGLNHQTLFNHNSFPTSSNAMAMAAFQQQYGAGAQQSFANGGMFQPRSQPAPAAPWDAFAAFGPDFGPVHGVEAGFQPGTELNPLFFSSNQATPHEDEEATVSPPDSERERERER
ncbi:hypothetical protein LTR86_005146 [Recurvomyces mirabilis]|nr:hypothetical protein LTR86_005146 [Recurvomyces mirabilis]